jgi:hypothetical protein
MDLQAPPRPGLPVRFRKLFAAERPDISIVEGQKALWMSFRKVLNTWGSTLQKFLQEDEDQFELLMTLDEYCSGHGLFSGDFSGDGPVGRMYLPIFSNVLFELWDQDLLKEQVARDWRDAKIEDDEDDRVCFPSHKLRVLSACFAASLSPAEAHSCVVSCSCVRRTMYCWVTR